MATAMRLVPKQCYRTAGPKMMVNFGSKVGILTLTTKQ
jgi:hypothetical protein